jgi:formylglycine-generating enzyme required for sulfatase activity
MTSLRHLCLVLFSCAVIGCGSGGGGGSSGTGTNGQPTGGAASLRYLVLSTTPTLTDATGAVGEPLPPTNTRLAFRMIKGEAALYGSDAASLGHQADESRGSYTPVATGFYCSAFEVTQGQWKRMTGTNPWLATPDAIAGGSSAVRDDLPAFGLSFDQIQSGLATFNASSPVRVRLLTTREWEYACRAGTTSLYSWGGTWGDDERPQIVSRYAVVRESAGGIAGPQAAGRLLIDGTYAYFRLPNAFGLYDMHGNIGEFVSDAPGAEGRLLRGGSWADNLISSRSAAIQYVPGSIAYATGGIRLALQ